MINRPEAERRSRVTNYPFIYQFSAHSISVPRFSLYSKDYLSPTKYMIKPNNITGYKYFISDHSKNDFISYIFF